MSADPKSPPRVCALADLPLTPRFEYGHMAQVAELTSTGDGTRLGTGLGRFNNAEIPWTVQYDEVLLVLEGRLTVRTHDGDLTAEAMQTIWLPAGTQLTYLATSALVFFAIEPANWAEG